MNSTAQDPVFDPAHDQVDGDRRRAITAANLDELDGYAFIRFIVNVSYPPPPMTPRERDAAVGRHDHDQLQRRR